MQIRWRSLYVEDLMKRSKKQRGWPYREVGIIGEKRNSDRYKEIKVESDASSDIFRFYSVW